MAFNGASKDAAAAALQMRKSNWADEFSPSMDPTFFRRVAQPETESRLSSPLHHTRLRNPWSSVRGNCAHGVRQPVSPVRGNVLRSLSLGLGCQASLSSSDQTSCTTATMCSLEPISLVRYSTFSHVPASPTVVYDQTPSVLFHPVGLSSFGLLTAKESAGSYDVAQSLRSPRASPLMQHDPMVVAPSHALLVEDEQLPMGDILAHNIDGVSASAQSSETPENAMAQQSVATVEECDQEMPKTTLMLRGLPNKYTREMVLKEIIQRGLMKDIDFFYLPIDLRHECNVGYCFLNVVDEAAAERFRTAFEGVMLDKVKSNKTCKVSEGKVQGLAANIEAYRNSAVISLSEKFHPLIFVNGEAKPFPPPTLTREEMRKQKRTKKGVSAKRRKRKDEIVAQ